MAGGGVLTNYSLASWLMSEERENLDWATYGVAARELAALVVEDDYRPDIILAIARGGLFVAGSLGYALSVKNLYVMNVEFYTCLLYTSPSPRDRQKSRMPSSA